MNFSVTSSLRKTSNILNLISERQKLLGTNIANMDTPGYQKQDINFSQILSGSTSSLETKLARKLDGGMVASETSDEPVNASEELVKMQNNSLLYTVATRRMSNIINQMKTVVNVGK